MNTETNSPAQAAQATLATLTALIQNMKSAADATGAPLAMVRQLNEAAELVASLAPVINEAALEERCSQAAEDEIFGEGEHEYHVMVTLQTTATRTMRIRADDTDEAAETARSAAQEVQGAYFEMNDGNYIGSDDISVNAVMDTDDNEFGPDEDYKSIAEQIAEQTGTSADDWEQIDGPTTGVGAEYWYENETTGQTAYVCVDQGDFNCSVNPIGESDENRDATPAV